jgi:hypothetical protein
MDDFNKIAQELLAETKSLSEKLRSDQARKILDRIGELPEQAYLDLASLAALITNSPVAAVSLIDEDTAYFKGIVGGNDSWSSETFIQAPRHILICNETIKDPNQNCIIYDAKSDDRVKNLPFVDGTYDYVRFYFGLPLVSGEGNAVGTLCVFDRIPKNLEKEQVNALERLRRLAINLYQV